MMITGTTGRPKAIRRRGATTCAAIGVALLLLSGCGDEKATDAGAIAPQTPSASASAIPAADCPAATAAATVTAEPGSGGDANPKYGENHAFQRPVELKGADLCAAASEQERVRGALTRFAGHRDVGADRVRSALEKLGYQPSEITVAGSDALVTYIVDLTPVCVEGSVGDLLRVETHGVYMEGTGCVKPEGGH
ncbi:hypothetical protein [Streptomyces sp. NPDC050145]|uniref:hypothetical protein n=1 Tax=Streptomyces sp. NPDC050145 TaxID=3365602 RepID=UPI003791E784